jgi:CheY-like chemotaxis protein
MTTTNEPRILLVDDEPNVLVALRRLLDGFDVFIATSGEAGLQQLQENGPFAVVVSDMRMPQMDGAAFLSRVRELAPDTVRILLTGHADVGSAIAAVNDGGIFRYLCKPCDPDLLQRSLTEGVTQHRLVVAERELLERTLSGAIQVLTEVLALVAPEAFSCASQIKAIVRHLVTRLRLADGWKYEAAAMLSQLGCIALPDEVVRRVLGANDASDADRALFDGHPETGGKLLTPIPRLEHVAEIIRLQSASAAALSSAPREVQIGATLLHLALDLHAMLSRGETVRGALAELGKPPRRYEPRLLDALADYRPAASSSHVRALSVEELHVGMILDSNVRTTTGLLIVGKGQEVSPALLERLRKFARGVGIVEPIRARVPA